MPNLSHIWLCGRPPRASRFRRRMLQIESAINNRADDLFRSIQRDLGVKVQIGPEPGIIHARCPNDVWLVAKQLFDQCVPAGVMVIHEVELNA